jgi:hypothetical protein
VALSDATTRRGRLKPTGAALGSAEGALAAAGAFVRTAPQLVQKDSPERLAAPQFGQVVTPGAALAGALAPTGMAVVSGSPHSSQNADPSGLS